MGAEEDDYSEAEAYASNDAFLYADVDDGAAADHYQFYGDIIEVALDLLGHGVVYSDGVGIDVG